ncbi:hypothetical protein DY000_02055205 [Brassica cretica]|uniref:Uncharacterized protein n=1 Tax=Brassica cretica TaxID=69181 RepID=A0ABQ7AJG8_BRACR|nr:hypothetical protein DY000_02055205 [Brassica cretica]
MTGTAFPVPSQPQLAFPSQPQLASVSASARDPDCKRTVRDPIAIGARSPSQPFAISSCPARDRSSQLEVNNSRPDHTRGRVALLHPYPNLITIV